MLALALASFDDAPAGQEGQAVLQVTNAGNLPLDVHAVFLEGDEVFALDAPAPFQLEPNEALGVPLSYLPGLDGPALSEGKVTVLSNDPQKPTVSVPLAARRLEPDLQFSELRLDLGVVDVPCGVSGTIDVMNAGEATLTLDAIEVHGDSAIEVYGGPDGTIHLAPGESLALDVMVDNVPEGLSAATVTAYPRDGEPRYAEVVVGGARDAWHTDRFAQDASRYSMLIAIDRTEDQIEVERAVQEGLPDLVNELTTQSENWSLGVVTRNPGCVNVEVFTRTSTNLIPRVLDAALGAGDDDSESLLQLIDRATAPGVADGCNTGVFSPDAPLHVVVISDADDKSGMSLDSFISVMQGRMSDPSLLTVSGVFPVTDEVHEATVCEDLESRYHQVICRTGGLAMPVGSDTWSRELMGLPSWASPRAATEFPLSGVPVVETLEVCVDGEPSALGWSFDQYEGVLRFASPPVPSAEIEATYAHRDICE